jgi:3-phenylpropionate/trans-cinnamate dioxygenase ferredoxin reductase subunit
MGKICKVTLNKETFYANCGDLLLDSALLNGTELHHDCRSGICGSCRVRLVDGNVFGGKEAGSDMIYACQARIVSDLHLVTESVPDLVSISARLAHIERLAPDVIGVSLELQQPLRHLPGQYCKLQFRGFPARNYSPSYPLVGGPNDCRLYFQIRRLADGLVSSELGNSIRIGHRVKLRGPFGSAFFRTNHSGRIVLVASGTGFAPMWSIAVAAIMEQPRRELVLVVAARRLHSFYMHAALCRLALFPNVKIIPIVSEPQNVTSAIRNGRPTDYLPALLPDDVVYTSGAPAVTDGVARLAKAAGAACYTDPFVSSAKESEEAGLIGRVAGWFESSRKTAEVLHVA